MSSAEEAPGGFTAVNGKENQNEGGGNVRRGSDERTNGQPRITPPGQEKLTITTTTSQREDWITPSNPVRAPYSNAAHVDGESHKRKRSGSIDRASSSATSFHSHGMLSSAKETPTTASTATTDFDSHREDGKDASRQPNQQDHHGPEPQYRTYLPSNDENRQFPGQTHWQNRQYQQPTYNMPDEQLGEVLQRASQNMDDRHHEFASPGDDDHPYTPYDTEKKDLSGQTDPKKRKRNFSNRTKTGCMTCRRRKKKCDETRPECELQILVMQINTDR